MPSPDTRCIPSRTGQNQKMPAFSRAQPEDTMMAKKSDADSSHGHISPGTPTMSHCLSIQTPPNQQQTQACRNTDEPRGNFFLPSSAFLLRSSFGEMLTPPLPSGTILNGADLASMCGRHSL